MTPPADRVHATDFRFGISCGIGAGALWGLVFLAPSLTPSFTPLQLAVGRYGAYGAVSLLLLGRRAGALLAMLPRRAMGWLCGLGLLGNTLYYALLSTAVRGAGTAVTALVIGFLPVLVTVAGRGDHGAAALRRMLPAMLFCLAGAVCIAMASAAPTSAQGHIPGQGPDRAAGVLCAIGALLCWTAFAVLNTRALRRMPGITAEDWNLLTGLATVLQALLLAPVAFRPGVSPAAEAWPSFLVLSLAVALLASIGGNALWNRMSRVLPMTMAGQMILFETVFALFYGWLREHRLPHPSELAALGCIAGGVVCAIRAHRPPVAAARAG